MRPTQAILPLVLIHTVIGGSAAVGRSILQGMGRVKAFTATDRRRHERCAQLRLRAAEVGPEGNRAGTICVVVARCVRFGCHGMF